MKAMLSAISTLTIIPLARYTTIREDELNAALRYFPLCGLMIGAILFASAQSLRPFLSPLPLAALLLVFSVLITGGLHLDGLADLSDGLGAGGDSKRILAVMKESQVGAFGVIALVLVLILKFALFHEVLSNGRLNAFLIMGLFSRWAMVLAAFIGKYPRTEGTGKPFIGQCRKNHVLIATALTLFLAIYILNTPALGILVLVTAWVFLFVHFLNKKIGGLTGDGLGALNEHIEVLVLFALVLLPLNH